MGEPAPSAVLPEEGLTMPMDTLVPPAPLKPERSEDPDVIAAHDIFAALGRMKGDSPDDRSVPELVKKFEEFLRHEKKVAGSGPSSAAGGSIALDGADASAKSKAHKSKCGDYNRCEMPIYWLLQKCPCTTTMNHNLERLHVHYRKRDYFASMAIRLG